MEALLWEAIQSNILPITGQCNFSCIFCSHRFNPPGVEVHDLPPLSVEKVRELVEFLDPLAPVIIGESSTRLREGEPFSHPRIMEILKLLRDKFPHTLIKLTTNGSLLDKSTLDFLYHLQPLELVISLNSINPRIRNYLMNDNNPGRLKEVMEMIAEGEIPFHGSVVAMPHLVGWDDVAESCLFLDGKGAQTIRLFRPGFTAYTPTELQIDEICLQDWSSKVAEIAESLECPLLPEPPEIRDLNPVVEGVIKGSPAFHAGITRSDEIKEVEGTIPRTRVEAFNMIWAAANPSLLINREGCQREIVIPKSQNAFSGITMQNDLHPYSLDMVRHYLGHHNFILLLTSRAAYPLWKSAEVHFPRGKVEIVAVPSRFWGGNICCAGLLTVSDIYLKLAQTVGMHSSLPEVILLPPQAFNRQGRDLTGRNYLELIDIFENDVKFVV